MSIRKFIRTSLVCAAVIAALGVNAAPAATVSDAEARPLDRIVAVVNRDVITEYELQNRVHQVALNMRGQNISLPPMEALRAQVLERLVLEKAIDQRAKEIGLRVEEPMVTAAIEQIARNNKVTVDELRDRLSKDGIRYSAFRTQIRQEILMQRLREREVDSQIKIPESEIDTFLAEQAGFAGDTTEYHIAHILIPIPKEPEQAEKAKENFETALKRAKSGEDFGKLAAEYSKSDDALSGGDLGWRDSTRLPSIFWQAIQKSHRKGTVKFIQNEDAYHIIKVLGDRDGVKAKLASAPVDRTHVRHILMFVSDLVPEATVLSRLNDIRHKLLAKDGDFATYARLFSVDNSGTRGGDLGWVQPGDMVPEFERAMNALAPGEISEPIRTQFGYHLIEVLERKKEAADSKRTRFSAMQTLRERKLAEAVETWQRELRDRAFVEIRPDHF